MGKAKKLAEGLKRIGDKVVKKRMTTKERNEMSKPFKKMLSEGQKSKKGMSKKDFDAAVKKGMAEDARIAKVKAENMAAATGPIKPVKKAAGGMMSPQPFTLKNHRSDYRPS
jgi:glutamate/tyrosine decarboxylase-like PLP-dependent enzyme